MWVSEIDAREEFRGRTIDYIQVACLRQVRTVDKFVCVLDGSSGTTTWSDGQVSILELELATAAFSKRDAWVFLLAPFDKPDPRIQTLLHCVARACPAIRIDGPFSEGSLLDRIGHVLLDEGARAESIGTGRLLQDLATKRSPVFAYDLALRDVRFLNGAFAPLSKDLPDTALVS